ncbi:IDEAL domain-containing protein [Alicyclobacillus mengziensis]|uniref:IDEAL domain-containing protein n=1 Tax=Alicyclobacillus mengziensis TaxID=2931921 RepID=A0A9X7VVX8_9BACL|nr:IDEAL domain-containing protein [Alicyclobacillus mengziensis]QSO46059.1 IDEAL domain-containing protein [Alicyclobacillus mengziensis]
MLENTSRQHPTRPPYTPSELTQMAEDVVHEAVTKWYQEWLRSRIDEALDERDQERFYELAEHWNQLYAR